MKWKQGMNVVSGISFRFDEPKGFTCAFFVFGERNLQYCLEGFHIIIKEKHLFCGVFVL